MKTNNLTKKSFLTSMILMATAAYHGIKESISYGVKNDPSNHARRNGNYKFGGFRARGLGAIYSPRHGRMKGYMRENLRSTFNKNR